MEARNPISRQEYERHGFTGPIRVFSEEQMARLTERFYEVAQIDPANAGDSKVPLSMWHWFDPLFAEAVESQVLLDRVEELIGPDIVVWNTHFWYKAKGVQKPTPWHQDARSWAIEPKEALTAWIALTDANLDNGCLWVAPSEERTIVEHLPADPGLKRILNFAVPEEKLNASAVRPIPMLAGEVLFFDGHLIHRSLDNQTTVPRIGLSVRMVTPAQKFRMDQWESTPSRVRLKLVRGQDRFHLNDELHGPPPGVRNISDIRRQEREAAQIANR